MGLASMQDTPRRDSIKDGENLLGTPNTPTPSNLLDIRKPLSGATSVKEHERAIDDLKEEVFDLKFKMYKLKETLGRYEGTQIEKVLEENNTLAASNEALKTEISTLKSILDETSASVEHARRAQFSSSEQEGEINRLCHELEMSQGQLIRTQNQIRVYEEHLTVSEKEALENKKKIKHLEMEMALANQKLIESSSVIGELRDENKELMDEINAKNVFVEQVKKECSELHSELQTLMVQKQEAENRARLAENERDQIKADLDPNRKRLMAPNTPGSPRSSIDLVESKLMKQVGAASKQMEIMAKSNALSQTERESLVENSRRLSAELNSSFRNIMNILERIALATGMKPPSSDATLEKATEELAKIIQTILRELDDVRRQKDTIHEELHHAHEEAAQLKHSLDRAKEDNQTVILHLEQMEKEYTEKCSQLGKAENECFRLEQHYKSAVEVELPKYREQCVNLQTTIKHLEIELSNREKRFSELKSEYESVRRRCIEIENEASKRSVDSAALQEELSQLRSQKQDLINKLSHSEEQLSQTANQLDSARASITKAEKVKLLLQENFNREMRELHSTNADLKAQIASITSGKSNNDQRLEKLHANLAYLENVNDELIAKLQAKETAYASMVRDHEVLRIESQSLERELHDAREAMRKAEAEASRLRRAEVTGRRGNENYDHLQAKLESLSSLNSFLKEQVEQKEKALRDAEGKLRQQDEEIRRAYADCDHQHQKLKKREMVINRVLKRLENINAVAGLNGLMDENIPETPNQRF